MKLIKAIQKSLTSDLLSKQWRPFADEYCTGHCYIAAEALYHLIDGADAGLKVFVASYEEGTHWWITNNKGKIFDPTKIQYTAYGEQPPYEKGRRGGFLTKQPSKRAQIVIDRVREILNTK